MSKERAVDAFEEALREDDPALLYERAPCGYVSTTPDGRILKTNETFQTWTGYSAEELMARSFVDLLSVGGRIYHETHYRPMLRLQGAVREIAVDVVRHDGSRLPVLLNARLDHHPDGTPQVIRIALFDATERRAYEQELVRARQRAEASEEQAHLLAHALQKTFIPPSAPVVPGLDIAGSYRSAGDGTVVGGDFYDIFPLDADEWIVVLGDVGGKGPAAAVVTAFVRDTVRVLTMSESSPAQVLGQLNRLLYRHGSDGRFCTCVLVRLSRVGGHWHVVTSVAGHPAPVLVRDGAAAVFAPYAGILLGVLETADYTEHELRLSPGDGMVLYTDGITEARAGEDLFGEQPLLASVTRLTADPTTTMAAVASSLVAEALEFQSGTAADDIAAIGLRVPLPRR
ncbi:PP2C family protein-serine/threonine phosphatase [Nocardioides sp. Kera G14]|uniref:PP2C family protein-serine/threonine phosphatase n=1 Tax=Nocardioides sp. Kera G14 TaxID=2884264 RepID=UPI001D11E830|nr:SpoIIE family protein phosphatase [Nocardioides sp. Kera G14]UDY22706.1 SpoIIE family protein phosphatase [Nocardioides sp. Kera G14]